MKVLNQSEPLFRVVKPIGDGAHVTIPKVLIGKQVKITIVEGSDGVKE